MPGEDDFTSPGFSLSSDEFRERQQTIDIFRDLNVDDDGRDYVSQNNSRAYFKVLEYGTCNDWTHFVTLTIDPSKYDRYNAQQEVVKKITGYFGYFKNNICPDFRYLLVPELHEDGAVHFHGLVYAPDKVFPMKFFKYDKNTHKSIYHSEWFDERVGRNQFIKIDEESEYCTYYITKYIQKSIEKICCHRYYCSQGLNGYKVVKNDLFMSGLLKDFVKAQNLSPSFSNDYIQKYQISGMTIDNVLRDGLLLNDDQLSEYKSRIILRKMREKVEEMDRQDLVYEKRLAEGLPIFTDESDRPLWINAGVLVPAPPSADPVSEVLVQPDFFDDLAESS